MPKSFLFWRRYIVSAWLPCVVIDNVCATWLTSNLVQHSYSTTSDYHMLQHSRLMESFPSSLLVTNVIVAQFHQRHTQRRINCSVFEHRRHLCEVFIFRCLLNFHLEKQLDFLMNTPEWGMGIC